jgi:hypothetical protein
MKTIMLKRVAQDERGTYGVMIYKDIPFCCTYELPWILNRRNVSCMPSGEYFCERHRSKGRWVFSVHNVSGRTLIQIHTGNNKANTKGCILPGEQFEPIGHKISVQKSRKAFNELFKIIDPDTEFILKIVEV